MCLATAVQCLQHYFPPFYLDPSLAKQGYEQFCRWASQGVWSHKASNQGLATCSPANMPLHQISVIPARETASNGRSSVGRNKEKNKEVEVRWVRFDTVREPTQSARCCLYNRREYERKSSSLPALRVRADWIILRVTKELINLSFYFLNEATNWKSIDVLAAW